jgi:GT2 family glycosyltransferase
MGALCRKRRCGFQAGFSGSQHIETTETNSSEMEASVGIITRTKDRPVLLTRAIESVVNQSYNDWRMVIVNDGGDPADVDRLVKHYASLSRGRISVIHNPESLGMEAASNKGVDTVQTQYLAIHDDDDTWAPEFLTVAVAELEEIRKALPTVAGVVTLANAVFERIEGNVVHTDWTEPYRTSDKRGIVSLDGILTENQFAPIQFLFRYDAAREVGFFRPELPVLGDWDFNVRFMCRYDIFIIPQFLAFYHHRVADQTVYGNTIIADRSRHDLYATVLKNEWLRRDIHAHGTGVGAHVTVRQAIHDLQQTIRKSEGQPSSFGSTGTTERELGTFSRRWKRSVQLARSWLASGKQRHYAKQFFRVLFSRGPGAAFRKVKSWFVTRHGG